MQQALDKHQVILQQGVLKHYPKYHVLRTKFGITNETILAKLDKYYKKSNYYRDYE